MEVEGIAGNETIAAARKPPVERRKKAGPLPDHLEGKERRKRAPRRQDFGQRPKPRGK